MMVATFFLWMRLAVLEKVIKVLDSKALSHLLATSVALDISNRDSSRNRYMLTISPTPSGSYVYKYSLGRSLAMM